MVQARKMQEYCELEAFLKAWSAACAWKGTSRMLIPQGTFLINPVTFTGPCDGPVVVQVLGTVLAPADLAVFSPTRPDWITFNNVDGLLITGRGTFDGQGTSTWAANDCHKNPNCREFPRSILFNLVTNSTIRQISSINSKSFHVEVYKSQNLTVSDIIIRAPADSPNTDGIHIGLSSNVRISGASIATGDDCVSIGPGSRNLDISGVSCFAGHGISVGSLGESPGNSEDVFGITVRNCTLTGTTNGVRIKTWQTPYVSSASNFVFEDITMHNVENPIIINQEYCSADKCDHKSPSRVKISDVEFKNIKGTSASKVAISLLCSKLAPCEGVELNDIDLVYNKNGESAVSSCSNVGGRSIGRVIPPSCYDS